MSNGFNQQLFGEYATQKFTDIYPNIEEFLQGNGADILGYKTQPFPQEITEESATTLYYLLVAKYGNSHISNMDMNQFMARLWSIVFKYGSTWESKLKNQAKLRALTDDDLRVGSRQINNHSYNPGEGPTTGSFDELGTINEQATSNWQKSKLDAYTNLQLVLNDRITDKFIEKFKELFIIIVNPYNDLLYESDQEED